MSLKSIAFPRRKPGRPSNASKQEYQEQVKGLCEWMNSYITRLGFSPSSRGWCYALETEGLINKGEFDKAITTLAELRKKGYIPFDFVASDDNRALEGFDAYHTDISSEAHIAKWLKHSIRQSALYSPVSYFKYQEYYPIVMVEKVDLVGLFRPQLPEQVKIFNSRGYPDVNSRVALIKEMMKAEENDLQPVILYCGDHDPAGLNISNTLREMLREISDTLGYIGLDDLEIERFGLNEDQIEEAGLTWIENLHTSSGEDLSLKGHKDHRKPYVQDYIKQYGVRKVEANALIANPDLGRRIMTDELWKWLDVDARQRWWEDNQQAQAKSAGEALNIHKWLCALDQNNLLFSSTDKDREAVIKAMKFTQPLPPLKQGETPFDSK